MLAEAVLDGGCDVPVRIRALAAVPPVLFSGVALVADPRAVLAVAAAVTVLPSLAAAAGVRLPAWFGIACELGGVAWLMAAWPRYDLSLMILVFSAGKVATLCSLRMSSVNLALSLAVPVGWQLGSGYDRATAWLIGILFAWASGVVFRKQRETMVQLRRAQQELAETAAGDERRRIAREVHDLVAHSLAVTMLHLTGARLALADGETAEAAAALESAETLGRSSMTGIRRAVGLLGEPAQDPSWSPEPDERDLAGLVDDYRRAGLVVELRTIGAAGRCEPGAGLALFRVVQESLANAVRHAPGQPVDVELVWREGSVTVTVTNPAGVVVPAQSSAGHGVVGMRERVHALGGEFAAEPVDGLWRVSASLPLTPAVEAEPA